MWLCRKFAPLEAVLLFAVATVASFIGSLQAGVVNTAVLAHTIKWGRQAGRRMAIGGAIPELVYGAVAYVGAGWLVDTLGLDGRGITLVVASILLLLGIYFLFLYHPRPAAVGEDKLAGDLRRGMLLGFANPQLLLFWCGVRLLVGSWQLDSGGVLAVIAFGAGAFTGAIILLMILVRTGVKAQEKLSPTGLRRLFKGIGVLLAVSGAYAVARAMEWLPG
jgi:threonine/homoserine/homoserine lactone efflux protein